MSADVKRSALIVVDMLNPYDHEDAEPLTESVSRIVEPVSTLIRRPRREDARNRLRQRQLR